MSPLPNSTDILIIGGGNAGLCAAISAREAGAQVVLVEHADRTMRGGNSRHTRNLRAMHEQPTATLIESYPEEEYWQDILRVTEGDTSENMARLTIRLSAELIPWLEQHGVHFQSALSGTLNLARTNAFFLGGGKALVNALYLTAEKLGVQIFYNTEAQQLTIEGGVFKSARVLSDGLTFTIRARSLIVTSGGFQANIEWMKQAWGQGAENFIIRGTPFARGRMLKELMHNKMKTVGSPNQCHAVAIDARAPKFDGGIVTRLDCICFGIVVNNLGKRFYDEGEDFWPKRYAIWGRLVAGQPAQIAYVLIDAKSIDRFMPAVFPPLKSDTFAGLARLIGLQPEGLSDTVEQYNRSIHPGKFDQNVLDDCYTEGISPAKSHWAQALDTPPYFAYPLRPGITFTYMGVAVNENARVISERGETTDNIFAAGEIMVGNILGRGYCAGTGMSIGGVFGRIAGENAACLIT